jgi:hypothetical protein
MIAKAVLKKYFDLDEYLELPVSDLYSKFDSYCSNCESSCEQDICGAYRTATAIATRATTIITTTAVTTIIATSLRLVMVHQDGLMSSIAQLASRNARILKI